MNEDRKHLTAALEVDKLMSATKGSGHEVCYCCWLFRMLRHACRFVLAGRGAYTRLIQDYLEHRDIRYTVVYTAVNPAWCEGLWR
jgi:site-specific recombinase XerD